MFPLLMMRSMVTEHSGVVPPPLRSFHGIPLSDQVICRSPHCPAAVEDDPATITIDYLLA